MCIEKRGRGIVGVLYTPEYDIMRQTFTVEAQIAAKKYSVFRHRKETMHLNLSSTGHKFGVKSSCDVGPVVYVTTFSNSEKSSFMISP